MKRQRGRGRKPNGQQNRHFESNGPDIKIRGSASHVHEKYQQLARDAASSGDRIMAENYLQHAEHYFRIVRAQQDAQRERAEAQNQREAENRERAESDAREPEAASRESNPLEVVDPEAADASASGEDSKSRRSRRPRRTRKDDGDAEAREALDASDGAMDRASSA